MLSLLTTHRHDHVFAHGPTVLTNPEHSEFGTECIFCALQARTWSIKIDSLKNILYVK